MTDKDTLQEDNPSGLKKEWGNFWRTIASPATVILLLIIILLFFFSIRQTDTTIIGILTVVLSLLTGVLGGIYSKRWTDLTEEKVITTRATSANRNLQLQLENLISLERRLRVYLKRSGDENYKKDISEEVIKNYLEETVEKVVGLESVVINSIEDWTDILPNVEMKTIIQVISDLKNREEQMRQGIDEISKKLEITQGKSQADIAKLIGERETLRNRLNSIQNEQREKSNRAGVHNLSGSLISGGTINPSFLGKMVDSSSSSLDVPIDPYSSKIWSSVFGITPKPPEENKDKGGKEVDKGKKDK